MFDRRCQCDTGLCCRQPVDRYISCQLLVDDKAFAKELSRRSNILADSAYRYHDVGGLVGQLKEWRNSFGGRGFISVNNAGVVTGVAS